MKLISVKYKYAIMLLILISSMQYLLVAQNEKEELTMNNVSIYDFTVRDNNSQPVSLEKFKDKTLLIVNVASKCGFTPQYAGLQKIYQQYKDQGFEILAFPCNDFGNQEPGSNMEIQQFCSTNFGVTFPLFDKITLKGERKEPLYDWLTNHNSIEKGEISWNFEKFLISRSGEVVQRFRSNVAPESAAITDAIEAQL